MEAWVAELSVIRSVVALVILMVGVLLMNNLLPPLTRSAEALGRGLTRRRFTWAIGCGVLVLGVLFFCLSQPPYRDAFLMMDPLVRLNNLPAEEVADYKFYMRFMELVMLVMIAPLAGVGLVATKHRSFFQQLSDREKGLFFIQSLGYSLLYLGLLMNLFL